MRNLIIKTNGIKDYKLTLALDDSEVHGLVGEGAEATVGDEADVHSRVLHRRLLDDQLVKVLAEAGYDVL